MFVIVEMIETMGGETVVPVLPPCSSEGEAEKRIEKMKAEREYPSLGLYSIWTHEQAKEEWPFWV